MQIIFSQLKIILLTGKKKKKSILICYQFIGKFNIFIVNLFTDNHIIVNVTTGKEELMSAILLFVYYLFSVSFLFLSSSIISFFG